MCVILKEKAIKLVLFGMKEEIKLKPIGIIHTPFKDWRGINQGT